MKRKNVFVGIPEILFFGTRRTHNVMVMQHLGPSLEDFFNKCNRKFSEKTALMLADQLVSCLTTIVSSYIDSSSRICT